MPNKLGHLEGNDSGGWRRVMSFDATHDDDADSVMHLADQLLNWGTNTRLKARIIMADQSVSTAPLMTWTAAESWREWVHPADRVKA